MSSSNMNVAVHTSTGVHRCRDDNADTSAICLTTPSSGRSSAFSREVLAASFNTPERDFPQFPFTPVDPLIVARPNPRDPAGAPTKSRDKGPHSEQPGRRAKIATAAGSDTGHLLSPYPTGSTIRATSHSITLALISYDRIDGRAGGRAQITQISDHRGRRRHALAIAHRRRHCAHPGCRADHALSASGT